MDINDLMPWKWPPPAGGREHESGEPLRALQTDINRAFESFWHNLSPRLRATASISLSQHAAPVIDVVETQAGIEIVADLPGYEEAEIEVAVGEDFVEIKARRDVVGESPAHATFHVRERPPRVAQRLVTLPAPVDQETVTATYRHGVLTVALSKIASERKPGRRIAVAKG